MKRKDLFKDGVRSVFKFAFEKTDDVTSKIKEAWLDEKKPPSEKFLTPVTKISEPKKKPKKKSKLFRTLSLQRVCFFMPVFRITPCYIRDIR